MGCRNPEKAAVALEAVKKVAADAAPEAMPLDLADLDDVRACAQRLTDKLDPLDVLMNNAGVMAIPHQRTKQGFEMQFGTNHLGHFALTGLLLPILRQAHAPRVVTVSSVVHRRGGSASTTGRGRGTRGGSPISSSKLAHLLFTSELQRRAAAAGADLLAVAAHPGYAATNLSSGLATVYRLGARLSDRLFAQSDRMGALPQLYAATMPDVGATTTGGPTASCSGVAGRRGWAAAARHVTAAQLFASGRQREANGHHLHW